MIRIILIVCIALLPACTSLQKLPESIPTQLIAAPAASTSELKRLVIVLPGRGDHLATLARSGIAAAIQNNLPHADVLFAEITLPYYLEGASAQRINKQIVSPARLQGYKDIWLMGASMGGIGVLMYEREYPGELTGLILMAPYMGDATLVKDIQIAGGLSQWQAGAVPAALDRSNAAREQWRVVQSWQANPARAKNVWLICGENDGLHTAADLIAQALPPENYIQVTGGHKWTVWVRGAQQALAAINSATK